jgi:hypothetical protein
MKNATGQTYFENPSTEAHRVVEFIAGQPVPNLVGHDGFAGNRNSRANGKMPVATRRLLEQVYSPYNELLYATLASDNIDFARF